MTAYTVGTNDLRAALKAVACHAFPKNDLPVMHRVRLDVGPENVTVTATDRFSAGLAIVPVLEHHDAELATIDLTPLDVKKILAMFKGGADAEDQPSWTTKVVIAGDHVRLTDTAGLFEGEALELLRTPPDAGFPDVSALVAGQLVRPPAPVDELVADGKRLELFAIASKAYGAPLIVETRGGSTLVVRCGESFLGLLMPIRVDEDQQAAVREWARAWNRRLAEVDTGEPL